MAARWVSIVTDAVVAGVRAAVRSTVRTGATSRSGRSRTPGGGPDARGPARAPGPARRDRPSGPVAAHINGHYPGDFTGRATISYEPDPDGNADPGEVVWAWVPFEEDPRQGKDRPVLVFARHRELLLALMLTSKDHDQDAADELRHGRIWMDIGTGEWDRQRRPSEVRLDRILQLEPGAVRREGARLDRRRFDVIAARLQELHGW